MVTHLIPLTRFGPGGIALFSTYTIFKAFLLGLVLWLLIHQLLRDWMYSGEIWHPMLMDLSIFVLTVSGSLWILASW